MSHLLISLVLIPLTLFGAEKWTPLFNGSDLAGWEQKNGTATYSVEKGIIVGRSAEGSPNSFLCTRRTYGDFILEFEVLVDPVLNSGVQIRSHTYGADAEVTTLNATRQKRKWPAGRVHGYQVEISSESSADSGGIYDEARRGWLHNISSDPAARVAFRDNQWNRYRVEARGVSIKTWINGVPCANLIDTADLDGFIGLQVHAFKGPHPKEVRWRNLRIQDLGRHTWKPLPMNLAAWERFGGGDWTVADGVFRGIQKPESTERGFLLSKGEYGDFAVRLQYRAVKGNSGFFFRMNHPKLRIGGPIGYEVEVYPTRDAGGLQEPGGRGWILHTGPAEKTDFYQPDVWNEMAVAAYAGRITVLINGTKTADANNDPGRRTGRFGLQLNPKQDLEVLFRSLEILSPATEALQ
ncbi:MAG: DUF1080 domain-containing protein [Bryobacteraceae bacterium]